MRNSNDLFVQPAGSYKHLAYDIVSIYFQAVIVVLEGSYPAEVKEQALCILGNIGDGEKAKDMIMANEDVLRKLVDYLVSVFYIKFLRFKSL